MAKSFAQATTGMKYIGKTEEIERLVYAMHVMGSYQLVQELMSYMSVEELKEFNDHVNQHYDLAEMERSFDAIPF
jgi:hypothetical protein